MELVKMQRYESYKDSGVDWIGEIPNHWDTSPLKRVLTLSSEKLLSYKSNLSYVGMENIESWSGRLIESQTVAEGLSSKFYKGDILFGKLRPYLAKVTLAQTDGICSTEFLVYRTRKHFGNYFRYSLCSKQFINIIDASTYGSKMPRASSEFIGLQPIPLPPASEQTAIAIFLDQKTAQIDEAIAIKEQQIELLKERKQIIIQKAVTQGLNPNVPMKDSGVEWIGTVPEHWEVKKVKNIFRLVVEPAEKNNSHELLSVYTDIGVKPRAELEERGNKASTTDGYLHVKNGDIVVNKLLAWMGAIGLSEYDGVTSPAYDILRSKIPVNGFFYHMLFRADFCSSELKRHSRGIMDMRLRLYFDKLGVIEVPYPPINEQHEIVKQINLKLYETDQAISLFNKQIEKLKEYKTTLINSAVTGKIRVVDND